MRSHQQIVTQIKNSEFTTKVRIFMSSSELGNDADSYENNKVRKNLNPLTIKAYVRDITGETSYFKQYGLNASGIKEILCEAKYINWFKKCSKIEIDDDEYQVFQDGGGKTAIIKRPMKMIRVTVTRMG